MRVASVVCWFVPKMSEDGVSCIMAFRGLFVPFCVQPTFSTVVGAQAKGAQQKVSWFVLSFPLTIGHFCQARERRLVGGWVGGWVV